MIGWIDKETVAAVDESIDRMWKAVDSASMSQDDRERIHYFYVEAVRALDPLRELASVKKVG